MSDLISRKEAVDAVNAYLGLSAVSRTIQNMTSIQEILENLPSAEPKTSSNGSITCVKSEKMHDRTMGDCISRKDAIKSMANAIWHYPNELYTGLNSYETCEALAKDGLMFLPSAEPEWLTDDDFEAIRIHLNAQKEKLCNQQRWEEAEEYQRIIDRFMAFASAEPENIRCKDCKHWMPYDWMFSEVWQSKNMEDYPEDEIGCDCCDMNMRANDYCSRAERRGEQE